ncbi:MAG: hypothetical protein RSB76_00240 [Clostridia bacterium]
MVDKNNDEIENQLNKYKMLNRVLELENDSLKYNYRVIVDENKYLRDNLFKIECGCSYKFSKKMSKVFHKVFRRKNV